MSRSSSWLIAQESQGPWVCAGSLSATQAQQMAQQALQESDVQPLANLLSSQGPLDPSQAQGCLTRLGTASAQGLQGAAANSDTVLVQVPAGPDAALYYLQSGDETNSWATLREPDQGGQWLVHLEAGLESDRGLGASDLTTSTNVVGVDFFLPDQENTQAIVAQVKALYAQQGLVGADQDWAHAQVVLVDATAPQATALIAVPPLGTQGQMIWAGGSWGGNFNSRHTVLTPVQVQRTVTPRGGICAQGLDFPCFRFNGGSYWHVVRPAPVIPAPRPQPQPIMHPQLPPPQPAPKPQPQPQPQQPVIQQGGALLNQFKFCPYLSYDPLGPASPALCQGSWDQWYGKQWTTGQVKQRVLQAADAATGQGVAYRITYAWDHQRGVNLLAAGFDKLSSSDLQKMVDYAAQLNQASPTVQLAPDLLQRWQQAYTIISTIPTAQFQSWMSTLAQTLTGGTFDQAYEQLLPQGLAQYQQALMLIANTSDPTRAKQTIKELAQIWLETTQQQIGSDPGGIIKANLDKAEAQLLDELGPIQTLLDLPGADQLAQILNAASQLLKQMAGLDLGQIESPKDLIKGIRDNLNDAITALAAGGYQADQLIAFSQAIVDIISGIDKNVPSAWSKLGPTPIPTFGLFNSLYEYGVAYQLEGFLTWILNPSGPRSPVNNPAGPLDKLEQGVGTLLTAANLVNQGWVLEGLFSDENNPIYSGSYGAWWGGGFQKDLDGKTISLIVRGDNCSSNCLAKKDEISSWVNAAEKGLPGLLDHFTETSTGQGVIALAFTNSGAQIGDLDSYLKGLYGNDPVPIELVWTDSSGQIHYDCISAGCSNLNPQQQKDLACNLLGKTAGCLDAPSAVDTIQPSVQRLLLTAVPDPGSGQKSCAQDLKGQRITC